MTRNRPKRRPGLGGSPRAKRRTLALAIGICFGATRAASASPADTFGFGAESQGMGATGAALGSGFAEAYLNPARLGADHRQTLSAGAESFLFSLHAYGIHAPGAVADGTSGLVIGLQAPIPFGGLLRDRIAIGIASFTPVRDLARARLLFPERPQFPILIDRADSLNLDLGLGADLGHGIRVGASLMVLAGLVGNVDVQSDVLGRVATVVDDQLVATYAPVLGASVDLDPNTVVAATWRGALRADFDVVVRVHDLGSLVVPDLHISGVAQYDPMQLYVELGRRLGAFDLAAGATYKHWSALHGWLGATVRCPPDRPDCAALPAPSVALSDTVVPRVGAAWHLPLTTRAVGTLRAGYFLEPSPLGEQTGAANIFDATRHALTFGYGVDLAPPAVPIHVAMYWQHHFLVERRHVKSPDVDPSNAGYPSVSTGGSVDAVGLVAGVDY